MSGAPIRILLVDDHRIMREGLALLLGQSADFDVVGQASSGAEALDLFREMSPDIVICDLRMTPMDGIEITEAIRNERPDARIVLLTTYDTDHDVFNALRAGAASYLRKDVDLEQLADTLRAVHSGKRAITPAVAAKLAEHLSSDELTARQAEVLKCLALGKSNAEIGEMLFISEGTVKAHVKAVLHKLGVRDRAQAIGVAIRRGLVHAL